MSDFFFTCNNTTEPQSHAIANLGHVKAFRHVTPIVISILYKSLCFHPSILYNAYPVRVAEKREPIPTQFGQEAGLHPGKAVNLLQGYN